MISNDTGPLHLAAAAGAQVLGLYTCTSPTLTGPFGPNAATVQTCVALRQASARPAIASIAWPS